jgi:type VI secretion system secreted protein Hcp
VADQAVWAGVLENGVAMSDQEAGRIARAAERVRRSRGGLLKVAIPTAAVLGAGAAVAVGSIPGGDGTITACYVTTGPAAGPFPNDYGTLRVIDPSITGRGVPTAVNQCAGTEATITWNQRGPQGPQGLPGAPGPPGGQGPAGSRGAQGTPLIGDTSFAFGGGGATTFLKLDGVKGEATDAQHKSDIELTSFSLGATGGEGGGSSGAGARKTTFQSFKVIKKIDKASPLLFKDAATGRHYKEAEVALARKAKGKKGDADFLVFKFSDVIISSLNSGASDGKPSEAVTFKFRTVEEQFVGPNGKVQQTVKVKVNSSG